MFSYMFLLSCRRDGTVSERLEQVSVAVPAVLCIVMGQIPLGPLGSFQFLVFPGGYRDDAGGGLCFPSTAFFFFFFLQKLLAIPVFLSVLIYTIACSSGVTASRFPLPVVGTQNLLVPDSSDTFSLLDYQQIVCIAWLSVSLSTLELSCPLGQVVDHISFISTKTKVKFMGLCPDLC